MADEALNKMVKGAAGGVRVGRAEPREAVLDDATADQLRRKVAEKGRVLQTIPINLLRLDANLRQRYDEEALQSLCDSLKKDGLIQYPTIYLRESDGPAQLVCCNGHRRIMAAKRLGWSKIDCVVVSFQSAQEQLYHVINANMREDVHFLDLAKAYADASAFGEGDEEIATRVGVNPRTVGWYRRLAEMSPGCLQLACEYPKIFTATWGVKMARRGPLIPEQELLAAMQGMVAAGRAWTPEREAVRKPPQRGSHTERLGQLRSFVHKEAPEKKVWIRDFVGHLEKAGLLQKSAFKTLKALVEDAQES